MGARFKHLANVCGLPFPDPIQDHDQGAVRFDQELSKTFRKRAIATAIVTIILCVAVMVYLFPFITGTKSYQPSASFNRFLGTFYLCPFLIVYAAWMLARYLRSSCYIRRLTVSSDSVKLNETELKNPTLIRSPVLIRHNKNTRSIEAIRVVDGKRSYIVAAKDLPEELDLIESMIPHAVEYSDVQVELKGVL
jgi:hypothetical protein